MNFRFFSPKSALLGLSLAAVIGAGAMAQPAAPAVDGTQAAAADERAAARQERRAERQMMREAERAARLESHIAYLQARLMISEAQAPLWDAFAEALRNDAGARAEARQALPDRGAVPESLPQRLERQQSDLAARSARIGAMAAALTPLYGVLDDGQKEIADRLLRDFGGGPMAMFERGPPRRARPGRGRDRGPFERRFDRRGERI